MYRPESVLIAVGCLHFLQIPSTAYLARRLLELGPDLARLTPLNGQIVRIFIAATSLLVASLGLAVVSCAHDVAHTPLGRCLCLLLAVFWCARVCAQLWIFRLWPKDVSAKIWYFVLLAIYLVLALGYGSVRGAYQENTVTSLARSGHPY